MNSSQDPFLADAFFDTPGLLAVRFARRVNGRADNRLASFVTYRQPDVSPAINAAAIAKVIGFGVFVACIGLPVLRSCVSIDYDGRNTTTTSAVPLVRAQPAAWAVGLEHLADDLTPTRDDLRPWMVRTLLDVPRDLMARGAETENWLQPRHSDDDERAHRQGQRLAAMLTAAGAGRDLVVILDVPGPAAVAAAAGMAQTFDPVFTMDNLPHSNGVVPAMQTLSALVYWRETFMAARKQRGPNAPAVFVLEGNRLDPYANEVERFDNRSTARLPDADGCKALGVSRILYIRSQRGAVMESDDLNEHLTDLTAAGIEVKYMALENLDPVQQIEATDEPQPTASSTTAHLWFWHHYGWYRPLGTTWSGTGDPDAAYRAVPRTTMFSHGVASAALDGGRSQRETLLTRLTPIARATSGSTSGSSSTHHTTNNTTHNNTPSTHASGGSWMRSSSHSSG